MPIILGLFLGGEWKMRKIKKQYTTVPGWMNFYKELIIKDHHLVGLLGVDRIIRIENINKELEPFHAMLESRYLIFESEAHYNWFVLRWA